MEAKAILSIGAERAHATAASTIGNECIYPSKPPRPGLSPPPTLGGFFMTTKPQRSKCRTIRSAAIRAVNVSKSWSAFCR